jgi:uncharacterized protein Yka (UPF0111/DUF47 family)
MDPRYAAVEEVAAKASAYEPADRYPSMDDLIYYFMEKNAKAVEEMKRAITIL